MFGFEPAGEVKDYGKLKTAPVILLHANGQTLQGDLFEINKEIYNNPTVFDFKNRHHFNPGNFIDQAEFGESVATFINKIWNPKQLQVA